MPEQSQGKYLLLALALASATASPLRANEISRLEARVAELQRELAAARVQLDEAVDAQRQAQETSSELAAELQRNREANEGIVIGPLTVGGAMRVNYVYGSYDSLDDGGPSRGGHGGNVELDTFRLNMALDTGSLIGKFEYRWYAADTGRNYNFMHTGWLGYRFTESSHVEVGVNRVPFGAGPYGISQSYFFDQHYYLGLADDPDLGVKFTTGWQDWAFDVAWYLHDEPSFSGRSVDSTRYGYDAVRWNSSIAADGTVSFDSPTNGFRESDQFNARAIRKFEGDWGSLSAGLSLQYGQLEGRGVEDGEHWAASTHALQQTGNWTLGLQVSRYEYQISADNPWNSDKLLPMGAYDFAWPVAARAWVPAVSISYRWPADDIAWLDYALPYLEWSSVVKDEAEFNDSQLWVLGTAWAHGGWYVYSEMVYSDGNYFIGSRGDDYSQVDGVGDFGVNGNDSWNYRFNVNFGYYY